MGRGMRSAILIALGLLLIAAALGLTAYNLYVGRSAGDESSKVAAHLMAGVEEDLTSGQSVSPQTPMPIEQIDGNLYIGVLRVPSLGLELSVMNDWSYPGLRVSPCRYSGSAYADDMVIAAHNYQTHFGRLNQLEYGAEVSFTDVRGNVFVYEVASIESLDPFAVDAMIDSDYELTLFTCTLGGADRVTVRCTEVLA